MRPVSMLLAVACCVPALSAAASDTTVETRRVQPISYERLLTSPLTFQSASVRFNATWIGISDLYDSQRSHFHPERYINLAVWDERAALWDPTVRANPLATLYMGKDMPGADLPAQIPMYQQVEIEGRIAAVLDGKPWIEVVAIRPLANRGAFSAAAIAEIEQAVAFAGQGARDLADEHFASALATDLPATARIGISELRARSLMEAGRWADAAATLRSIIARADADTVLSASTRAGLHAALARSISEQAGTDQAQHTAAVTEAQTAIKLDPTLSEAYAVLGVSLAGLGRFDEARMQSDRAVRMRPNDAAIRLALGRILDQQGRHDEAIEALKRAIDLTPKDARAHRAVAAAYLGRAKAGNAADLPTALKECEITLRLAPQDAEAQFLAGQVLEAATAANVELPLTGGKAVPTKAQALERYQAALAIDPNFAPAKAALKSQADAEATKKAEEAAKAAAEARSKAESDAAASATAAAAAAKAKAEADAKAEAEAKAAAEAKAIEAAQAAAAAAQAPAPAPEAAAAPEAAPMPVPAPEAAAPAPAPEAAPIAAPEAAPAPAPAPAPEVAPAPAPAPAPEVAPAPAP